MKNSQLQLTAVKSVWAKGLLASTVLALMLLAPLANAEKADDEKSGEQSSSSKGGESGSAGTPNTIVIGGSAGSMSPNAASASAPVTAIVIQEQTIASPYNY